MSVKRNNGILSFVLIIVVIGLLDECIALFMIPAGLLIHLLQPTMGGAIALLVGVSITTVCFCVALYLAYGILLPRLYQLFHKCDKRDETPEPDR